MKKDVLDVKLVQALLTWHKPDENLAHISKLIKQIESSDLIVLPEMWNTGFTMKAHLFHKDAGVAIDAMKSWSKEKECMVCGSLIVKEGERYYNRFYFMDNGKEFAHYDKRHLFAFSGEDKSFTAGSEKLIFDYRGWKICPNVCYDLRFPVWSRNYEDYDILLYTANWPDARVMAWKSLLKARAIENQCFTLGVNCYGTDAWNNSYSGYSAVYGFEGELLLDEKTGDQVHEVHLDKESLSEFRRKFPFLKERDRIETPWDVSYLTDSK